MKFIRTQRSSRRWLQVLAPVNDQVDLNAKEAGGSHWSLVCYVAAVAQEDGSGGGAAGGAFYHINSMEGSNEQAAGKAARGVAALTGAVQSLLWFCQAAVFENTIFAVDQCKLWMRA